MKLLPTINYPSKKCKIGIKSKSFRVFENDIFKAIDDFEKIKKFSHEEKEKDAKIVIMLAHFPEDLLKYLMFKGPGSFRSLHKRDLVMKAIDVAVEVCEIQVRFYQGKGYDSLNNAYVTMWSVLRCLKKAYKKEPFPLMKRMNDFNKCSYFLCLTSFAYLNHDGYGMEEIDSHCAGHIYLSHLNAKFKDLNANLNELRGHMIRAREFIAEKEIFPSFVNGRIPLMSRIKVELSERNNEEKRFFLYKWDNPPLFRFRNFEAKYEEKYKNEYQEMYKLREESSGVETIVQKGATVHLMHINMCRLISWNSELFSILLFHAIQIRWVNANYALLSFQRKYRIRRRRLLDLGYEEPSPEEREENLSYTITRSFEESYV
jgi:hypothetical protein